MSTEGEWRFTNEKWSARKIFELYDAKNRMIASNAVRGSTDYDPPSDDEFEQMFSRIVTAVNCHEELVGLVEKLKTVIGVEMDEFACKCLFEEPRPYHGEIVKRYMSYIDRIDAVLAKAKPEETV